MAEVEQINVYCRLCKKSLLVTDTSQDVMKVIELISQQTLVHLFQEHRESCDSVIKRIQEIHNEYITPTFEEISEKFGE